MPNMRDQCEGWPPELVRHLETQLSQDTTVPVDTQASVISKNRSNPPTASVGDRYLIAASATGVWANHSYQIAEYRSAGWWFIAPVDGMTVWVDDEDQLYIYSGTAWLPNPFTRETIKYFVTGAVSVGAEQGGVWEAPSPGYISHVMLYRKSTTGTGSATIIDVHIGSVTVFTTQSNRPSLAFNDTDKKATATTLQAPNFNTGDLITVDVDQIDSGGSPSNITVIIGVIYGFGGTRNVQAVDFIGISDSVGLTVEPAGKDTIVVPADQTRRTATFTRVKADTAVDASDGRVINLAYGRKPEDAVVVVVDAARISFEVSPSDTIAIADDVDSVFMVSPSDTITMGTDDTTRVANGTRSIADTAIAMTDGVATVP